MSTLSDLEPGSVIVSHPNRRPRRGHGYRHPGHSQWSGLGSCYRAHTTALAQLPDGTGAASLDYCEQCGVLADSRDSVGRRLPGWDLGRTGTGEPSKPSLSLPPIHRHSDPRAVVPALQNPESIANAKRATQDPRRRRPGREVSLPRRPAPLQCPLRYVGGWAPSSRGVSRESAAPAVRSMRPKGRLAPPLWTPAESKAIVG
jgi:hypothetical protein